MKFDDLLSQYLYEKKTLQLQGIGTFTFEGNVNRAGANEKEIYYPIEGLEFNFSPKLQTEEDVVIYLTEKLGKIKPLVRSDLESYLTNMIQFINIGKPYTIEGIGTLQKNNQGIFEFTPGNFLPAKEVLNPVRENAEHNYHELSKGPKAGKVILIAIIVIAGLAALGGIGWGIATLVSKNKNVEQPVSGPIDTTQSINPPGAILPVQPFIPDSSSYKMIFELTYSRDRAQKRTTQLKGLNIPAVYDSLIFNDTTQYRLFIPVKLVPQDTLRVKDSIKRYFNRPVIISG